MRIDYLGKHTQFVKQLAAAQFELWGPLTGSESLQSYEQFLLGGSTADGLPVTLIALDDNEALGSVNLVECDLPLRTELNPWLAQLYVFPEARGAGVGAALVHAAVEEARQMDCQTLYLYTSGTLPNFYERLGWRRKEEVAYLGKKRVVMQIDVDG